MGTYRGAGGVEWDIDEPAEGTQARERFDAQVKNGDLVLVEAKKAPATKKAAPADDV
jgi:hypothetical protein